jgi:hypothetical protein
MGAALQRIYETASQLLRVWPHRSTQAADGGEATARYYDKVGEFYADYSPPSEADMTETDPDAEALLARSTVVSSQRLR